jgi:16S rRNA U1498 N3-methylase RsmE
LTLQYVLSALEQSGTDTIPVVRTNDYQALSDALQNFSEAMEKSPANKLLKDI